MFEDIQKLKNLIVSWLLGFVFVAGLCFFFGPVNTEVFGFPIQLPLPEKHSFAVIVFQAIQADLLPDETILIAMSPFSAMNTQILVALLIAFLMTFPWLLYRLAVYVSPALYVRERRALLVVLFPAMILFIVGGVFAYRVLIPPTLKILYSYTEIMGSTAFFSMDSFITFVAMFIVVTSILFLLPVFMVVLSFLGIIPASFWHEHWRAALLMVLLFSAIITPDGSGVSMMLLSLPLGGLYAVGAGIASIRNTG